MIAYVRFRLLIFAPFLPRADRHFGQGEEGEVVPALPSSTCKYAAPDSFFQSFSLASSFEAEKDILV